jgi:hypothetical protein
VISRLLVPTIWDLVGLVGLWLSVRGLRRAIRTHVYLSTQTPSSGLRYVSRERLQFQTLIFLGLTLNFILSMAITIGMLVPGEEDIFSRLAMLIAAPFLTLVEIILAALAYRLDRLRARETPTPNVSRRTILDIVKSKEDS